MNSNMGLSGNSIMKILIFVSVLLDIKNNSIGMYFVVRNQPPNVVSLKDYSSIL